MLARFPTVVVVRRFTRTHRLPRLRSIVIWTTATRVVATLTVTDRRVPRFLTLPDSDVTRGSGHPSFEIAYSAGHASFAS